MSEIGPLDDKWREQLARKMVELGHAADIATARMIALKSRIKDGSVSTRPDDSRNRQG